MKTPTVLQMEAVECGAASLAIVLGYFGRRLALEELRVACDVTRDGTKASNILQVARQYGLKAKGFRKSLESVQEMAFPVIIHWNFNHFLVLEGFGKDCAYLSDPAMGRYAVTMAEFADSFTGVALAFEKGEEFQPGNDIPGLAETLWTRLRHSRETVGFVLLASLCLVVPGLVTPAFSRVFVDDFLVQRMSDWVPPLLLCMGLVMLLNAGITWVQQRALLRLETKLAISMSSGFFWHVLHLPMEFFAQRFGGEVGSRVQMNDSVARALSGEMASTVLSAVTAIFFLALMIAYDGVLTVVCVAIAATNVAVLAFAAKRRKEASMRMQQESGKLFGTTLGGLAGIETMKAAGAEGDFFARWSGQFTKVLNAEQELGVNGQWLGVLPTLLSSVNTAAILCIGAIRVMNGDLTLGLLVAFQYLSSSFIGPVTKLVQVGGSLQVLESQVNRLEDVLRYPRVEVRDRESPRDEAPSRLSGALELRDVTFGYGRLAPPLIERLSLSLVPGSRVALVGGSGSGKSTVSKLVCGMYQPWDGEILFDGMRREAIVPASITSSLALVDQDILLFGATIKENLSLWNEAIPEAQLVRAAKDACIHDDIVARRGAYDALVAEGGANFSGGQRQRLEIARALAQDPSILVLDEATSALDATIEKRIMDNVRRRGCTCLIVAHRLSTVRDCDEIVMLRGGRVEERGTHHELVRAGGAYARLISAA